MLCCVRFLCRRRNSQVSYNLLRSYFYLFAQSTHRSLPSVHRYCWLGDWKGIHLPKCLDQGFPNHSCLEDHWKDPAQTAVMG